MFTVHSMRKSSGRQPRSRRSAVYIAPSDKEYIVEVVKVNHADGSAQVIYEWSPGKFQRMWVGIRDLSGRGVR